MNRKQCQTAALRVLLQEEVVVNASRPCNVGIGWQSLAV